VSSTHGVRVFAAFVSAFACACHTTSYECRATSSPFGLFAENVVFRVIGDRPAPDHDDSVAIFTHREQYDGDAKDVDFDHEEIVRITARMGSNARVASVTQSQALLGLIVDATHCAPGIASTRQIDVVLPLTPLVPQLWVNRGAACRELP
jgi:hypothetical protein